MHFRFHILRFCYREFHKFGQAKVIHGGLVLGLRQILLLPQLPQKNDACFKNGQRRLKK